MRRAIRRLLMSRSKAGAARPMVARRRQIVCAGLGSALLGSAYAGSPRRAGAARSSFTIAVLPDTQFYSRYATVDEHSQFSRRFGSEPFAAQTNWIAANARALNIAFTIHLGDVVDQVHKPQQWAVADRAMRVLEAAGQPYAVLAGNHDVLEDIDFGVDPTRGTDMQRQLEAEPYLKWFGPARAARQASFRGRDATGFHEQHVFSAQGQRFMVLSLSWRCSDAGIAWARRAMVDNPTLPVILVNHQLLAIDKDGKTARETDYGLMLWERLIRDNDQIFLTLNGHHHGAARLTKINDFGRKVEQMVVDYQMAYQGGNGLMRLYEFDLTHQQIKVLSFSPWVVQKPAETLNSFDQAVLSGPNEAFVIDINFAARFAGFCKGFAAGGKTLRGSPVDQARAALLAGYQQPSQRPPKLPADADDYPKVEATLAHWRFFGGAAGEAVPATTRINDEAGANPLRNERLNSDDLVDAAGGDMVWSDDRHVLSAAPGSVRFLDPGKRRPRMSGFVTDTASPLNMQTFEAGYTVEAFVKIDRAWTRGEHAWMNVMSREGRRGDVPGFSGSDPEATPLLFAISNLRELQWEVLPGRANAAGARAPQTCWSGEVLVDTWVHVAVVNDAGSATVTLYVEGAPVLRNAAGALGVATLGQAARWVIGCGSWNGRSSGAMFGHIGEIRVVGRALEATDWLTARRR